MNRFDRHHSTDAAREECMSDVDTVPCTLLEEKVWRPACPGTAGDETGVAAAVIRSRTRTVPPGP